MPFDFDKFLYGPIGGSEKILKFALALWMIFWKGLALWRSSRRSQKYWFVVFVLINTFGILEIIYLAFFQRSGEKLFYRDKATSERKKKKTSGTAKKE
jgi:hypothetical protein